MAKRTNTAKWITGRERWQINVQKDGERKTFSSAKPGRAGQRECNAKADAWLENDIVPTNSKIEYLYKSFQDDVEQTASTMTKKHITSIGRVWIIPYIGNIRIAKLCDQDIQYILDKAASMGRSKKTIQDINATINKFLKYCRRKKWTNYRPEEVSIPASARLKGKSILQPDDFVKLMNCDTYKYYGTRVREPYINAYRFAVLTGLRPGELRGLKREDVCGRTVTVRGAINDYGEHTKGKNDNAIRRFVLSDMAYTVLQEHLSESEESEYLFDVPAASVYRKHWIRFCESNEMSRTTPYEMRHTFVSVAKNLPAGQVKSLVGHSKNMDTFGIYGHVLEGDEEELASEINVLFEKIAARKK